MINFLMISGFILLCIVFPMSIILTIVFAIKKKKKVVFSAISIPISFFLSLIFLGIGGYLYGSTDEYKEIMAKKNIEEREKQEKLEEKQKLSEEKARLEAEKKEKKEKETEQKTKEEKERSKLKKKEEEDNKSKNSKKKEEETEKIENKPREEDEAQNSNSFVSEMAKFSGENIAEEAYDVLTNQIGFSDVEFGEKIGETSNYEIIADSTYMFITAMEDYYRVFIPDTSYIFYEDGKVITTAKEFNDSRISDTDMSYYYTIAQSIVEDYLKSPKSADFPWKDEISYQKKDNLVVIKGYVDAENSFGAEIRSNYVVQFYVYDLENFSYEPTYIEIDGENSGEFINME